MPLIEARLERFQILDLMRSAAAIPEEGATPETLQTIADARAFLAEAVLPTSKFSAMAEDMLAGAA